jgi:hypothetical protein
MEQERPTIDEIYRLTKDNNRMLHTMRRNAFWGGIIKFVIYALLLLAPIWFYMTYLNSTVEKMLHTIDQIQGTGSAAQTQFQGLEASWREFQAKLGFGTTSTTTSQH